MADMMSKTVPPSQSKGNLMQIKIMYWGPGEAGKTTNFHRLKEIFAHFRVSEGYSIATTDNRTLWNDSVNFKFHLGQFNLELLIIVNTTTGQERFLSTREYILQNADGVIFVADSNRTKIEQNIRSFEELIAFTRQNQIPMLIQLNKRDIDRALSVEEFKYHLDLPKVSTDAIGHKIVYTAVANNPDEPGEVKQIFLDLIQKILRNKLVQRR
jgi:mutual gliding-motility protein MglA